MLGRRSRVKCFNATYSAGSYAGRADLGLQVVPVERIVGSVGRCEELDARFRPFQLTAARQQRLENIRRLVEAGHPLPPVELYRLKDEYFVIDGNHRVAVAKENGQVDIEAHVIEFLPDGQRAEDRVYLERRAFARATGLEQIEVGQLGGYVRLHQEIVAHQAAAGQDMDLRAAAASWYRNVYQPLVRLLEARHLPQRTQRSAGDLYLDLSVQRAHAQKHEGQAPAWEEMVARLEQQYPMPSLAQHLVEWWQALRTHLCRRREEDLPCAYALLAPDGHVYCRRAGRAKRGISLGDVEAGPNT